MTADPGSGTPMSERMQALLSRAVEDQLSEQRQVQGAMNEVRNHLAHLGAELQQLRATAGGAADEEIQRQVAGVAADVREAIRVLGDRIDAVSGLVQQRGNDLSELRAVLENELRPRVDGVDAAMRDLRGAFTGIGARVADLPGRQDIEGMIARAGTDTSGIDERLESLQGWVEEVHAGLFGEDGVHPRVQALVEQAAEGAPVEDIAARLESRISEAVRSAVASSEQRIIEHVDEAVLALAEALLRKRSRTGTLGLSAFDTGPIPIVPAAPEDSLPSAPAPAATTAETTQPTPLPPAPPTAELDAGEHHDGTDSSGHASPATNGGHDSPATDGGDDSPATDGVPAHIDLEHGAETAPAPQAAFQPATVPGAGPHHDDYGDDDEAARRRRPWWRPGD